MKVTIDNITTNYLQVGEGRDIVVLHGWGCEIKTVMPIVDLLKHCFRVTTLDLPGFGETDSPMEPWDSYDYEAFTYAFIKQLGIKKTSLIGHSHGGRISILLAANYPEIVDKVVLIDSAGLIPKRRLKYYFKVYSFKIAKKCYRLVNRKQDALDKFYRRFGSEDYQNASGVMRQTMVKVVNDTLLSHLKQIQSPTLLIWGENDDATPLYMAKHMEKEIQDSGLVVIKNAGHYSYLDDYHTFKLVLKHFLTCTKGE